MTDGDAITGGPKFVCMFSGGITSWAAAKRIAEQEGTEGLVLLFADTMIEDEDCYHGGCGCAIDDSEGEL